MESDDQPNGQKALNGYLKTLVAMANCMVDACPEVGEPYRHRLNRLRARLAFQATPQVLDESYGAVETELKEYAARASGFTAQQREELRSCAGTLQQIVTLLAQKQDFYGTRLRQFASQMESTVYPAEPEHLRETVGLQVAGLLSCVESLAHETRSLVERMRCELHEAERRMQDAELTDSLTGLMNRREMERQIESRTQAGGVPVLLHFQLTGEISNEVARRVAARLGCQFRHRDIISRWSDTEFLVMFAGPPDIAQTRAEQIVPWLAGRYLLDNGETIQLGVEVQLK